MIIDVHAHISGPNEIWEHFREVAGADPGRSRTPIQFSDDEMQESLRGHLESVGSVGTDLQVITGRPWAVPTYLRDEAKVMYITQQVNDMYARAAKLNPTRFAAMCTLPQTAGVSPANCVEELDRCVNDLGFVGVRIIGEPGGGIMHTPDLGDEWWYPLYEKMVELDVPALVHGGPYILHREPELGYFPSDVSLVGWALLRTPRVFRDFPNLKIIIGHGGGYIPYHQGLAEAQRRALIADDPSLESWEETLSHFYCDTVLYDPKGLELLIKTVGVDHCLFGTDRPANGDVIDPDTGHSLNDIKFKLDNIPWLSDEDRYQIYEGNARRLFSRLKVPVQA